MPGTELVTVFYNWRLIDKDPDDNKFVDCAVAANTDYLVTNDRHYNVLKKIDFPKVATIKLDKFMALLT
ncbi:MAG: PIN domain-containing protein [Cytophagales bacterium]|nr:PIN domain-containing protein [Cytophagales bacterium]